MSSLSQVTRTLWTFPDQRGRLLGATPTQQRRRGTPWAGSSAPRGGVSVGTWSTGVTGAATAPVPATIFERQTLRQVVHTSVGGRSVRVRLSNEFGSEALEIGEAHVARRATGSSVVPGTDRVLTFGGRSSITIPRGAPTLSDPVDLTLPAGTDLAISTYLPRRTVASTV